MPDILRGTLGVGEDSGGTESSSDWLARKADLHNPNPQTTVSERGLRICRGGGLDSASLERGLEASWRRHLRAGLDSSLFHSYNHHDRRTDIPWPTKLWCPVGTCHRPGGCRGRSSGCPASCPANDPTVARPACLQHCWPGLAQPSRLPITGPSLPS